MRHTAAPDARALQRGPADAIAMVLRRHRRGGRRSRALRRLTAILLLVAAGVVAVARPAPGDAPGTAVQMAARDLPAGTTLQPSDLRTATVRSPPDGALPADPAPTGRVLAAPVRRGEILTDVRLVGTDGPRPGPGRAAVPVRPDDPGTVALLRPGMRVAVIGVGPEGTPHTLTDDAVVLTIPAPDQVSGGPAADAGRLVVLSVPRSVADAIAATAITGSIGLRFA